ncbi:MAG: hypothetical protein GF411_15495 [Candidatus Lokiarchaeota archaeon]|nr:hypothetical protein [Candidatus Lokiarchaeota archaeon]
MTSSLVDTIKEEEPTTPRKSKSGKSFLSEFVSSLFATILWAIFVSMMIGSTIAGVWTIIPTELLTWGSSDMNLMGYVSHCNFAPISTGILLACSFIGAILVWKFGDNRQIGLIVTSCIILGIVVGLLRGLSSAIFLGMLIGMGTGVGISIPMGILTGLVWSRYKE